MAAALEINDRRRKLPLSLPLNPMSPAQSAFQSSLSNPVFSQCPGVCGRYLWSVYNHLLVRRLSLSGPLQTAWHELSLPMGLRRSMPKYTSWGYYAHSSNHVRIVNSPARWGAAVLFTGVLETSPSSPKEHPWTNDWQATFWVAFHPAHSVEPAPVALV